MFYRRLKKIVFVIGIFCIYFLQLNYVQAGPPKPITFFPQEPEKNYYEVMKWIIPTCVFVFSFIGSCVIYIVGKSKERKISKEDDKVKLQNLIKKYNMIMNILLVGMILPLLILFIIFCRECL